MRLIVTHEQPDFDALASLALARLLYPDAVASVHGALPEGISAFLGMYRDVLDLRNAGDVDLAEVTELVVVDTADWRRLEPYRELAGRVPITLYDHHPEPKERTEAVDAAHGLREAVGATVTLLTRALAAQAIHVPPAVASLALIGIHNDTGDLRYDLTTPADHEAAAVLLDAGANLRLVRRYGRDLLSPEHRAFRSALLEHARPVTVAGWPVSLAVFEYPEYVYGVAGLVSELLDIQDANATIVVVRMGGKTLSFARADEHFDVGAALADALGGGGHPGAAFASSTLGPEEVAERVLAALERHAAAPVRAAAIMSRPVVTAQASASIDEVGALLRRYGYNGVPVTAADGSLLGVTSRRDVERAQRHGLGSSPVRSLLLRPAVTAPPGAQLRELEALIVQHDIGRVPIVVADHPAGDGSIVGIVTRSDLLAARHPRKDQNGEAAQLLRRLPPRATEVLELASEVAAETPGAALYLVGGSVRDALLGIGARDLDLTVEGIEARAMGEALRARLGGTLACHDDFGTCTLSLPSGLVLDLATAREEHYDLPGALPSVQRSNLHKDLERRDFSVNAIAARVFPGPPALIDPFGGAADLGAKRLRLLHPLSFVEDPTRILRGARLAGRLDLRFDPETTEAARAALPNATTGALSRARLRAELEGILSEPRVAPALQRLDELGGLEALFGLRLDQQRIAALDALRSEGRVPVPDDAYLLALLVATPAADAERAVQAFGWPQRLRMTREHLARPIDEPDAVLDDELEALDPAQAAVVMAAGGEAAERLAAIRAAPPRRKLRGSDVLGLGLAPGPAVGRVLDEVARARSEHRVHTFDDELELARRLLRDIEP